MVHRYEEILNFTSLKTAFPFPKLSCVLILLLRIGIFDPICRERVKLKINCTGRPKENSFSYSVKSV